MIQKITVTGGTGYIGSNLLNYLSKNSSGFTFTICDRNLKKENLSKPELYEYIQIDLSKDLDLPEFNTTVKNSQLLIHSSLVNDKEELFINHIAKTNPQIKFIYLSSAAIYGELEEEYQNSSQASFNENSKPNPINDYGRAKLQCEELIKKNFKNYLILRIANPYAREVSNKGIYKLFKTKLEAGERKLNLNADFPGQIIRDFIHIDELCSQISTLIINQQIGTFNISSGKGIALEDLIQKLASEININYQDIEFKYNSYKTNEIKVSILDNQKILSLI